MRQRRNFFLLLILLCVNTLSAQIPEGYYDAATGLSDSALKTALHRIIRGHHTISYNGLWTAFYNSDDKPNGKVWDMYSDNPDGTPPYEYEFGADQCSTTPGIENSCYNREHSFPQSYFGSSSSDTVYTDLFQLYPTDSYVNTRRNNYPYGTVANPTWTSMNGSKVGPCSYLGYTGTVFEPLDAFKGDLARTYFYIATRYEHSIPEWTILSVYGNAILDSTSFPCFEPWFLAMLMEWHEADPVSQKETDRNNAVYALQGNRNPYIDHPEYVGLIWGGEEPVVLPEPTNYPASFSAHSILLQWQDATGTTVPDGYLIRMGTAGFNAIAAPEDGVIYLGATDFIVPYGLQSFRVTNLSPQTTYYFKMFSFSGDGITINYKTDGSIPQTMQVTGP
jgi:endonuclease I